MEVIQLFIDEILDVFDGGGDDDDDAGAGSAKAARPEDPAADEAARTKKEALLTQMLTPEYFRRHVERSKHPDALDLNAPVQL